jgi:hypothetical protein
MAAVQEASRRELDQKRTRKSSLIQQARQIHLYLGTLFAPAILFFAITGALQTFSFHERTRGSNYEPPVLLMKLAQLHKKQTLTIAPKKPAPQDAKRGASEAAKPSMPTATLLMKWFTFLMGVGLVVTTLLGIYMSFKYNRNRLLVWGLLIAGTVLPAIFALA